MGFSINPPICAVCGVAMACMKTGQPVELMNINGPYQLAHGDQFACQGCGAFVVANVGTPIAERFQQDFYAIRAAGPPLIRWWNTWSEKAEYERAMKGNPLKQETASRFPGKGPYSADADNSGRMTSLVCRALDVLGFVTIRKHLPEQFRITGGGHETGESIRIDLAWQDLPTITAWYGETWKSAGYSSGERAFLGINPECEFARPAIEQFFRVLAKDLTRHDEEQARKKEGKQAADRQKHADALNAYKRILEQPDSEGGEAQ